MRKYYNVMICVLLYDSIELQNIYVKRMKNTSKQKNHMQQNSKNLYPLRRLFITKLKF